MYDHLTCGLGMGSWNIVFVWSVSRDGHRWDMGYVTWWASRGGGTGPAGSILAGPLFWSDNYIHIWSNHIHLKYHRHSLFDHELFIVSRVSDGIQQQLRKRWIRNSWFWPEPSSIVVRVFQVHVWEEEHCLQVLPCWVVQVMVVAPLSWRQGYRVV